jgi:hypothetical protein
MQRRWNMRQSQETIFQNLIFLKLINAQLDETTWFLDSGCSNHMFGHKFFFFQNWKRAFASQLSSATTLALM